jgi:uncharacterized protein (TIGR02118 family)
MVHHHYFLCKQPHMTLDEFYTYWRRRHVKASPTPILNLRRYIQGHRVAVPRGDAPFDGVTEAWYDSLEAMLEQRRHFTHELAMKDEAEFIDHRRVDILTTLDDVILDGEKKRGMIKGVFLVKRKASMLRPDFKRYWKEVHAPLALKLPGLRRYVQSHTVDEAYEWAEPRWDGVAHLYFDDAQAAEKAMTSDVYINESGPDVDKFIGTVLGLWVQEHHILPVDERPK